MVVFLCPQQKQRNKVKTTFSESFSEMVSILRQTAQGLFFIAELPQEHYSGLTEAPY